MNYAVFIPAGIVLAGVLLSLGVRSLAAKRHWVVPAFGALVLVAALVAELTFVGSKTYSALQHGFVMNAFSELIGVLVIVCSGWLLLGALTPVAGQDDRWHWYPILVLLGTFGALVLASTAEPVTAILGWTVLLAALVILASSLGTDEVAELPARPLLAWAGVAWLAVTLGLVLTATTGHHLLFQDLTGGSVLGLILVLAGCALVITEAPFQVGLPDFYRVDQGTASAAVAVLGRIGGLTLALRVLDIAFRNLNLNSTAMAVSAAVLLVAGAAAVLAATSIRRVLGYGGLVQLGMITAGLAAGTSAATAAVLYYLVAVALGCIAAYGGLAALRHAGISDYTDDLAGLWQRAPLPAAVLSLALLSLAGLPPLLGFFGLFWILAQVSAAGLTWLSVVAIGASLVVTVASLRLVLGMYTEPATVERRARTPRSVNNASVAAAAVVTALGFLSSPLAQVMQRGADVLTGR
ncbi:MAG: proton-conducting transporter transmembrane domain-containing protein [Candidatus Dormibacteria bacterium]